MWKIGVGASAVTLAALLTFNAVSGNPIESVPPTAPTFATKITVNGPVVQPAVTIAADDVTPDVSGGGYFVTSANTGATAITDLDNPVVGAIYDICGGSNTNSSTIADSGNFNINGAITLSADNCITLKVQADNDYVELSRNVTAGSFNVQSFTGGAGSYAWSKPANAASTSLVWVIHIGPGGGGGSGGFDSSDSGGGGGGAGTVQYASFFAGDLASSVTVTLTQATGGAAKNSAGNGNAGSDPGASSFGAHLVANPTVAISGTGGTNASGTGGTLALASYTTWTGVFGTVGTAGGDGDDGATASSAGNVGPSTSYLLWVAIVPPGAGGGGGGTNGGANFTAGGVGSAALNSAGGSMYTAAAGGAADGADGTDGTIGGTSQATTPVLMIVGGQGGGGGAGAIVADTNGGDGGDGGNCGGGGGGGGAKNADAGNESGAGGNGGASCVWVLTIL